MEKVYRKSALKASIISLFNFVRNFIYIYIYIYMDIYTLNLFIEHSGEH